MAAIWVAGIVSDGGSVLLVRATPGAWELPGGTLLDADESIESALVRILSDEFGLAVEDQEFLDTYYPRAPGEEQPTLVNVSLVRAWSGSLRPGIGIDAQWTPYEEVAGLGLEETARAALGDGLGIRAEAEALPGAPIVIITGPAGAGKSTVSRELCRRLERSAHLNVDEIRHMVIGGYASPIISRANPVAAAEQNELQLANVAALARNFSLSGFQTIIDLVVETPEELDCYLAPFAGLAHVHVVTLLPNAETLRRRDQERAPGVRMGERSEELRQTIAANGETRGLRLDSSELTAEQTAEYILANLETARVL